MCDEEKVYDKRKREISVTHVEEVNMMCITEEIFEEHISNPLHPLSIVTAGSGDVD